jgi:hypothetical protein
MIRRSVAWLAIIGYGLIASGLPVPLAGLSPTAPDAAATARLAAKDRSRPFPCMDKPCGCATAEQCFTNCCCHTPAERLAWARARGLEPAVRAALERRAADPAASMAATGCCDTQEERCCSEGEANCCDACQPEPSCCGAADPDPEAFEQATGFVVLRAMLACGGIVAQWTALGMALPPPETITLDILWPLVATVPQRDQRVLGTAGPPELPPPRLS